MKTMCGGAGRMLAAISSLVIAAACASGAEEANVITTLDFLPGVQVSVHFPPGHDPTKPTPVVFFTSVGNSGESLAFTRLIPLAEEMGWVMMGPMQYGEDLVVDLVRESETHFAVHPTLRFVVSFWQDAPVTTRIGSKTDPPFAGEMCISARAAKTLRGKGRTIILVDGSEMTERSCWSTVHNYPNFRSE